jgi:LuxR family maltose regulon positive regulatory protein
VKATTGAQSPTSESDRPIWLGPSFEFLASKLRPPAVRAGVVPRTALLDRLVRHSEPVISVTAPPGYGKSTLMAQWAERKGRRTAWVSVDRRDNDPVVLLTYVAVALDRIEPIDQRVFGSLSSPGVSASATVVPRFVAALSSMTHPVVLVLDHVELLDNRECLDAVAELAVHLPPRSQLVIASRGNPPLPVALLRAQGQVVEIGVDELAMNRHEAQALLQGAGVELADADVDELIGRTEGWPVGLYLAALALKAGGPRAALRPAFTGDDRFMADYLRSELLARLPQPRVTFLTRTAVLDRMSGPLCDAVLDASRSTLVLESLEGSNLLVVALDRHREWYRYHHLFRELLQAELDRREPELLQELHARAATWCEANRLPEMAIDHAQAAGDADRVARLVAILTQPAYAGGRVDTARRWLAWFEDQGLIERFPAVAVLGTWIQALLGRPAGAERWAAAAERGTALGTVPDGSTVESWRAMVRGLLCRDGMERMRADARIALEGLAPASTWRGTALLMEGLSFQLEGEGDQADPILAHCVEVATHARALPAASVALAERSLVAIQHHDWQRAETLAERALQTIQAGRLDDYSHSALIHAVAARTALHGGDGPKAREHLARAARLRPLLTYAIPSLAVQTLLELVRAYLALDDAAGARAVLRDARDILQLRPDLGTLSAQADELGSKLATIRGATVGASSLTTAELRLLPLLFTHLSFPEIGERLYLSRHTVKTQAISVYRKLGVSSRSQAIHRASELGLLVD